MKFLLTMCLLTSLPAVAGAQQTLLSRAQRLEAERGLSNLGYWTGPVDGVIDQATRSALSAFQKWEGRTVSGGELTREELEAIRSASSPKAREIGYEHVEVDLDRQILLMVREDGGVRVLPVSTGNDKPFDDEGQTSIAYTPRGRFLVYEKVAGWEKGMLGSMYYSNYISGGVAIHGSPNVPNQPGSHGCIRVPMFAARELSRMLPVGTIVLVYDKLSFVSAKSWIENPKLKQAALSGSTEMDYTYVSEETKNHRRPAVIKQTRPRIIRAQMSEPRAIATGSATQG
jgi:peptidoglycan hydrolase-like protein with peptidoglycan-binding domain